MSLRPTSRSPTLESFELGPGEHAALALAQENEDSLVLLDDAAARAAASAIGVATTGTLGVLLLAKQRGLIGSIAQALADLEAHRFRMTAALRLRGEPCRRISDAPPIRV